MHDEFFMNAALKEAERAFHEGEVPVGAVLVCDGKIIAKGHNLVESLQDATAHAEMLCLKQGARILNNWRLNGSTLYCTLEPCSMCAGAMILSRVSTIVWGAPDLRHGADGSWIELLQSEHPIHRIEVRRGVLREESAALLTEFFRLKRIANKQTIPK
ncbi:MAG TPA: tRNA adenosine(34) deaminase TadA [Rhabdochlamydiaceae bacterium]|nr:tRNA adenosine(34) deaminase TadA [Rhabdochlamydiaceae bacterium]